MLLDELLTLAAAPPAVPATAGAEQAHGLGLHVPAVPRDHMPADEGITECLEFEPFGRGVQHRRPHRHQNRRIAGRGQAHEAPQRVQRAVGVAGPGSSALRLRALHHRAESAVIEAEYLRGRLHHDAHLVVVLATGQAGSVRGRAHLHQQDRRVG
jgi:hypothetical protein